MKTMKQENFNSPTYQDMSRREDKSETENNCDQCIESL